MRRSTTLTCRETRAASRRWAARKRRTDSSSCSGSACSGSAPADPRPLPRTVVVARPVGVARVVASRPCRPRRRVAREASDRSLATSSTAESDQNDAHTTAATTASTRNGAHSSTRERRGLPALLVVSGSLCVTATFCGGRADGPGGRLHAGRGRLREASLTGRRHPAPTVAVRTRAPAAGRRPGTAAPGPSRTPAPAGRPASASPGWSGRRPGWAGCRSSPAAHCRVRRRTG